MTELTRILVNESYNTILSAVNRETHPDDIGIIIEELEGLLKVAKEKESELSEPEEKKDVYVIRGTNNEIMATREY